MRVLLKRTWFDPQGHRHRRSIPADNPTELDDNLREFLPSDAKVVDDDYKPRTAPKAPDTLSEAADLLGADPERAAAEAASEAEAKADKFKADLAAEKSRKGGKK
jgi:hypothetical protein